MWPWQRRKLNRAFERALSGDVDWRAIAGLPPRSSLPLPPIPLATLPPCAPFPNHQPHEWRGTVCIDCSLNTKAAFLHAAHGDNNCHQETVMTPAPPEEHCATALAADGTCDARCDCGWTRIGRVGTVTTALAEHLTLAMYVEPDGTINLPKAGA